MHVKNWTFTLCVKDNDTTKTANIKIVLLQVWDIFTTTHNIAMFYLNVIVRTCAVFDINPLNGFKINSLSSNERNHMHEQFLHFN